MFDGMRRLGLHPLPAVRHRRDPQVLQLLPGHADGAAARRPRRGLGAARRESPSPATTPRPSTPASAARSPSARRSPSTATPSPSAAARIVVDFSCGGLAIEHGATVPLRAQAREHGPRPRAGHRRGGGRAAVGARRGDAPRLAADALVRPPADDGRHPARLRQHPADHPAPLRPDVHGPDPRGPGGRAPAGVLAARLRPGAARTSSASAGPATTGARSIDRRAAHRAALGRPLRPGAAWTAARRRAPHRVRHRLYHSLIKPCFAAGREPVLADVGARSRSTSARCGTCTRPSSRC